MRPLPVLFSAFLISLASIAPIATPAGAAPDGIAPGTARVATIEATAPLDEESEGAVKAAITSAIQTAARGALAMGLPWVHIQSAYVRPGFVGVQVIAMAEPPSDTPRPAPEREPGNGPDQPATPDDPPAKYRL